MHMSYISSASSKQKDGANKLHKSIYSKEQLVKFINLQAQVDYLLQKLQSLQEQKLANQKQAN
ncbi:hypothetical protein RINTHH_22540 [Richelia intracellularis HH01]|uniref:Uncharacterized protein n=1 Tax=Richelia intracellularis HH01 TaxID=1165094 RepID=M1WTV0_9NOST|nr:hypothetical protein [Richelia intracellularis]CCH68409.1 hypothetical protein RINTHH_22540 [Richelia intracellularis HH01]